MSDVKVRPEGEVRKYRENLFHFAFLLFGAGSTMTCFFYYVTGSFVYTWIPAVIFSFGILGQVIRDWSHIKPRTAFEKSELKQRRQQYDLENRQRQLQYSISETNNVLADIGMPLVPDLDWLDKTMEEVKKSLEPETPVKDKTFADIISDHTKDITASVKIPRIDLDVHTCNTGAKYDIIQGDGQVQLSYYRCDHGFVSEKPITLKKLDPENHDCGHWVKHCASNNLRNVEQCPHGLYKEIIDTEIAADFSLHICDQDYDDSCFDCR